MPALKILITSGGGLIGQYLNIELSKKFNILSFYHTNPGNALEFNSVQCDLTNFDELERIVLDFRPDVIIHNAAISKAADADRLAAKYVYGVNVIASEKLARLSAKLKSQIIYTSTDLIYAGYRGSQLNENAKAVPISFYAETKLMGEVKIQSAADNYIILRTALMYGFGFNHSSNHFGNIFDKLKRGEQVELFTDQYRSPLELSDAAELICKLIESGVKNETINFGGPERLSRFEMGRKLCRAAGFDENLLIPKLMSESGITYQVPDVSIDISKLLSFGLAPRSMDESLKRILQEK